MNESVQNCMKSDRPEKRIVALALPLGADGHVASATANSILHLSSNSPNLDIRYFPAGSSALVHNFNHLWCEAVNLRLSGEPVEYFAMIHSDIVPEEGWLQRLIQIADRRNFDFLSVVSPIKDERGLVSAGLDTSRWTPRRFTLQEIHGMPETVDSEFARAKFGAPLLINTGCMLIRMTQPWAREFFFDTSNGIAEENGRVFSIFEPEDWKMSRWANARKLNVGMTRSIRLIHLGGAAYSNDAPWGKQSLDEGNILNSEKLKAGVIKIHSGMTTP